MQPEFANPIVSIDVREKQKGFSMIHFKATEVTELLQAEYSNHGIRGVVLRKQIA
jgi:hypothetical protein